MQNPLDLSIGSIRKPFPQEQELAEAMARLVQLNAELSLNETETVLTEEPEAA